MFVYRPIPFFLKIFSALNTKINLDVVIDKTNENSDCL